MNRNKSLYILDYFLSFLFRAILGKIDRQQDKWKNRDSQPIQRILFEKPRKNGVETCSLSNVMGAQCYDLIRLTVWGTVNIQFTLFASCLEFFIWQASHLHQVDSSFGVRRLLTETANRRHHGVLSRADGVTRITGLLPFTNKELDRQIAMEKLERVNHITGLKWALFINANKHSTFSLSKNFTWGKFYDFSKGNIYKVNRLIVNRLELD